MFLKVHFNNLVLGH